MFIICYYFIDCDCDHKLHNFRFKFEYIQIDNIPKGMISLLSTLSNKINESNLIVYEKRRIPIGVSEQ